ncbi:MAG: ketopantoate reductase family protein [Acidimicrobiales bacterium]
MQEPTGRLRIAILGAGGVGGLIGGLLARQGEAVTFVVTESTAETLTRDGLSVSSAHFGSFRVAAHAVTSLGTEVDVCVVSVKATQLEAAVHRVSPDVLGDALVIPFLNGVDHVAELRARYGPRIVPATMRVASTRTAAGVIEHRSPFLRIELAVTDGEPVRHREMTALASHLRSAGAEVEIRDSELSMLWGKLIFLCPLALLTTRYGVSAGEIRTTHRGEMLAVITEIARIGGAVGADLSAEATVRFFDSVPEEMQSSMQHDAAAGRPIELDAIGGAVLRAATRTGQDAPVTARLVDQLRRLAPRPPT